MTNHPRIKTRAGFGPSRATPECEGEPRWGGEAEPDLNGPSAKPNRAALPREGVRTGQARKRRVLGRTESPPFVERV